MTGAGGNVCGGGEGRGGWVKGEEVAMILFLKVEQGQLGGIRLLDTDLSCTSDVGY